MNMKLNITRFRGVKNFESTNFDGKNEIEFELNHMSDLKNQNNIATSQCEKTKESQKYHTRSTKLLCEPLQISFQENFLTQHEQSTRKQLQNYKEAQSQFISHQTNQSLNLDLMENLIHQQDQDVNKVIRQSTKHYLTMEQAEMFIIDLRREDKLKIYLQMLLANISSQVRHEVLYLANMVWVSFIRFQDHNLDQQEIKQFADNLTNNSISKIDQTIEVINLSCHKHSLIEQQQQKRLCNLKKVVSFLIHTLTLVINGYFENPYLNQPTNYFKREYQQSKKQSPNIDQQVSDSDNQSQQECFGSGRKKFKY